MHYLILSSPQVCEMRARVITIIFQMKKLRYGKTGTGLKTQVKNGAARVQPHVSLAPEPQCPNSSGYEGLRGRERGTGISFSPHDSLLR